MMAGERKGDGAIGGAAVLLGGFALLALLWIFRRPLALLVISVTVAAALAPVVGWLDRKLPRGIAVALLFLGLALLLGLALWFIFRPLVGQVTELVAEAPALADRAQAWLEQLQLPFDFRIQQAAPDLLRRAGTVLLAVPTTVSGALFDLSLVIFVSVYLLIEAPRVEKGFLSLFPEDRQDRIREVGGGMLHAMGGYIRAAVIGGAIVGALTYAGLMLIGVDYALVLGLLAGLLELLPIIGPVIAAVPVLLIALLQAPLTALLALVFMIALQQVEGNLIMPNIVHSQTPISPLLALTALALGGTVGGLIGAIVAIPIAGALHVFFKKVVAPAIRRRTGAAKEEETDG